MSQTTRTHIIKLSEQRDVAEEIPQALRLMLETIRRALLMAAHAIGKYLGREN